MIYKVNYLRQVIFTVAAVLDQLRPVLQILLAGMLLVKLVQLIEHDTPKINN